MKYFICNSTYRVILLSILLFALQSCIHSPLPLPTRKPKGIFHTVLKNQTLWRICRAYKVSLQDVAELNNIKKTSQIRAGDKIFIPGAKKALSIKPVTDKRVTPQQKKKVIKKKTKISVRKASPKKIISHSGMFKWPVKGTVVKRFGIINKIKHDGINIKAPTGSIVKASSSGRVVFSAFLEGYGNTIIIEHGSSYATVYANNSKNLVTTGKRVQAGGKIATVGTSAEKSKTPYLHFQVRKYDKPRNPAFYLPKK